MKQVNLKTCTGLGAIILAVLFFISCGEKQNRKHIIAYVFVKDRLVDPALIEAEKLTHINYAFADIRDGKMVEGFEKDAENFEILKTLKNRNPALKILISVGGWTWSGNFSDVSLTRESRALFIKTAVDFVRKYELDGLDVDWEFPGLIGYGNIHRPEDKHNFTLLMKEIRTAFDAVEREDGKRYITSIAAGAFDDFVSHSEMGEVAKYLDFMNLMTYDFCESEVDTVNQHHAALYTNPAAPKPLSTDHAVKIFTQAGVPAHKIVLGAAFYGRAWGNVEQKNNGLFQAGGPVRLRTSYTYIKENLENMNGFLRYWDDVARAPYLWNDSSRIFISYEDDESVAGKCEYIRKHQLKGIMFWEYHSDHNHELLHIMHEELYSK